MLTRELAVKNKTPRRSFMAVLLVSCSILTSPIAALWGQVTNPDDLPMFGQPAVNRPENLKESDRAFVASQTAKYGNRGVASDAFVAQAWKSMRNRKVSAALRQFNQGWLLNPKNPGAFWGFGAVSSERGNLPEAIKYLETARELMDDVAQRVQLLADIGAVRSAYAGRLPRDRELERAQQYSAANQRFAESLEIDPRYARSWREWAISLFEQERYSEAWVKAKRAQELKAEPFPADFLKKLDSKIAEPK